MEQFYPMPDEQDGWMNKLGAYMRNYAQNPPSMAPQLAIALGLLNPTLGRATRDMAMARGGNSAGVAMPEVQGAMPMPGHQAGSPMFPANNTKPMTPYEFQLMQIRRMNGMLD